jgi:uracil-DNA glycosylase family 4
MRSPTESFRECQNQAEIGALAVLAAKIDNCRVCDNQGIAVQHPASTMFRGRGRLGMVVGIQPGNTELRSATAFSGAAGTRLVGWLIQAGVGQNREQIFERMYFTSLAKCGSASKDTGRLVRNCLPFLSAQIEIIGPKVLITLGVEPVKYLFGIDRFDDWVGRVVKEQELQSTMFPLLPSGSGVVVLPHPSPLSRWLNARENKQKLKTALSSLKDFLRRD